MKPKSKKNIEVEIYVDSFKTEKGYAPTYEQVAEHFNGNRRKLILLLLGAMKVTSTVAEWALR